MYAFYSARHVKDSYGKYIPTEVSYCLAHIKDYSDEPSIIESNRYLNYDVFNNYSDFNKITFSSMNGYLASTLTINNILGDILAKPNIEYIFSWPTGFWRDVTALGYEARMAKSMKIEICKQSPDMYRLDKLLQPGKCLKAYYGSKYIECNEAEMVMHLARVKGLKISPNLDEKFVLFKESEGVLRLEVRNFKLETLMTLDIGPQIDKGRYLAVSSILLAQFGRGIFNYYDAWNVKLPYYKTIMFNYFEQIKELLI